MTLLALASFFVFAIDKPLAPSDPFDSNVLLSVYGKSSLPALDISASPLSIAGSECSNIYASTGDYCSGNIRIYYQCLQTMSGMEWQQRSENCEDYLGKGRCTESDGKARCVDFAGSRTESKAVIIVSIALILIGLVLGFTFHPIFFGLVILGIYFLIKTISGGV